MVNWAFKLPSIVPSIKDSGARSSADPSSYKDEPEAANEVGTSPSSPLTGHANQNATTRPWISWKLSWWFTIIFAILDVALITAVIALDQVSRKHRGIAQVPQSDNLPLLHRIKNIQQYYGMLWTTLPSFVFTLFGLFWATLVRDAAARQPFVELQRHSTPRKTILLDYAAYPSIYSWVIAFKNSHSHIALAMLLNYIISLTLGPLSSHLLAPQLVYSSYPLTVTNLTYLNFNTFSISTDIQSYIDIATAMRAYNAQPPPWMTDNYAFNRFSLPSISGIVNISAQTTAYSSLLDCQTIPESQYQASLSKDDTYQALEVTFTDRGCYINKTMLMSSSEKLYARTFFQSPCGYHTEDYTPIDRIILLSGLHSSASPILLSSFSITSCIPSYWSTTGILTLSHTPSSPPGFISFTDTTSTQLYPEISTIFEDAVTSYSREDASDSSFTDDVGFAVYSIALAATNQSSPEQAMSSDVILSALENLWATIYASVVCSLFIQPVSSLPLSASSSNNNFTNISATRSQMENRILTARPIVYILVTILILVLICDVILFCYTKKYKTLMLTAEPVGLLGSAVLLRDSQALFDVVDRAEKRIEIDKTHKGVVEYVKDTYGGKEGAMCWWEVDDGDGQGGDGDIAHGGHYPRGRTGKGGIRTSGLIDRPLN